MIEKVKKELLSLRDEKYQKFASSLLPDTKNILGVRLGALRKIAKKILKDDYKKFFIENDDEFFELTMVEAFIIGGLREDFDKVSGYIERFIKKINNWSICDSFSSSLKIIKKNKEKTKLLLEKYFFSNKEFELRFCYVVLLNYFIDDDFYYVMEKLKAFKDESYYAKMAAAWCLSYCLMKDFNKTFEIIKTNKIHPFVVKRGIRKALESYRLGDNQKKILRNFNLQKVLISQS